MAEEPVNLNSPMPSEMHPSAAGWLYTAGPSMQHVATGLGLLYASIVLVLLAVIAIIVWAITAGAMAGPVKQPQPAGLPIPMQITYWVLLGTYFLSAMGTLLCLATPAETGATSFIQGSVVFMLINIAITLSRWLFGFHSSLFGLISPAVYIVSAFLFVLFLRKLARFLGRYDLAARASQVLIGGTVFVVLILVILVAIAWTIIPLHRGAERIWISLALALTLCVTAIYVLVKYANLLNALRKTIRAVRSADGTLSGGITGQNDLLGKRP